MQWPGVQVARGSAVGATASALPIVFQIGGFPEHREWHDAPSRSARVDRVCDCAQEERRVRACLKHVHAAVQRAGQATHEVLEVLMENF